MINIRSFAAIATSLLVLSSAGAASAQERVAPQSITAPARIEPTDSVNLGLGTVWGSPSITYQHLFAGGHGLVIGANAFYATHEIGNGMGAGGSVGYRWHWRGRQDSGFLGLHAGFDRDRAPMRITIDEMTEDAVVDISTFYLVGNIGKRWMLNDDVNITARIGGGLALRRLGTDAEDAEPLVGVMNALVGVIPVTVDGELSVGYTF
jgi:hypothetical protein